MQKIKKQRFLFTLLMTILMMAMSPARMWAKKCKSVIYGRGGYAMFMNLANSPLNSIGYKDALDDYNQEKERNPNLGICVICSAGDGTVNLITDIMDRNEPLVYGNTIDEFAMGYLETYLLNHPCVLVIYDIDESQISEIKIEANDPSYGSTTLSNYFLTGSTTQISATPKEGYHFTSWSDGNTSNPREIVVRPNTSYTANFAACSFTEQEASATYCKEPATCTQLGVYYYKCSVCGAKGNNTFSGGSLSEHQFKTKTKSDEYRKSYATCTQKAQYFYKCNECDAKGTNTYEDGEVMPHKYIDKVLSVAADDNGLYSYTCNYGCGTADAGHKIIKDFAPGSNLQLDVNSDGSYSSSQAIALTDANNIADVNVAFTTTSAPTYTRQMSSAQWGTMVLPFDVKVSEQNDFELYKVKNFGGDNILLTNNEGDENGIIAAGTPVFVLRKGEGTSISVTAANNAFNTELKNVAGLDYTLTGNYESLKDISSCNGYVMANDNFWSIAYLTQAPEGEQAKKVGVGPFRAYIASNVVSNAKLQVLTDESTSIKQYATGMVGGLKEGKRLENGRIVIVRNSKKYNVNGQEVK